MDKKILGFIVFIVILTVSGVLYLLNNSNDEVNLAESNNSKSTSETELESQPVANTDAVGKYIEYNDSAVASNSGTKILFFHASWCPQCRELEADIENNDIPEGVTIIKVDYDSNQSLRQKYGVTLQTTIVKIDDEGNLVDKFVAYDDPSLDAIKANLL